MPMSQPTRTRLTFPLYENFDLVVKDDFTTKSKFSYNAIDIPVLVGWDIGIGDSLTVTPLAGVKGTFVVGKAKFKEDYDNYDDYEIEDYPDSFDHKNKFLFGLVFGVSAAYKLGPGALVGDVRYNLGLTNVGVKFDEPDYHKKVSIATPRDLQFSLGYQIAF